MAGSFGKVTAPKVSAGLLGLALTGIIACNSALPAEPLDADLLTLTVGVPSVRGQDPLHGITQAARLVSYEGLSGQSVNGRPSPRLAEGWSESPDGLTWEINLRLEAVFHDGTPVDAALVKASLEEFLSTSASRAALGLQDILAIEANETHKLTVRLKARSTLLLDDLDAPITKRAEDGSRVGTGAFIMSAPEPTSSNELAMTSFPRYHRGTPNITRLIWRLYPTLRTAWAATMRGEVDFLYEVGPESREFLDTQNSIQLFPFLRNYVYGVVFNEKHATLRQTEIRRALNYAIDRNAILERAFKGRGTTASSPVWPLHWAYDSTLPEFVYDPARAAASLDKEVGPVRIGNERRGRLHFVCLIPENFQLWEQLALMVQRDLAAIGVEMALEAVPFDEFNRRIAEGRFDAVLMEMISGFSVSRPLSFWHSSGLHNFSGYRNADVDVTLERIRRAASDDEYRMAFQEFQQAITQDPPAIFLAWGETARAVSRRFQVAKSANGDIRTTIGEWSIAAPQAAN